MSILSAGCQLQPHVSVYRGAGRAPVLSALTSRQQHASRTIAKSFRPKPELRRQGTAPCICCLHQDKSNGATPVADRSVSVVFLAGGTGKRMGASMPKQYLQLLGQPIAMHSLNTFGSMKEVGEIIVVCDPSYRDLFQQYLVLLPHRVKHSFALPGKERQDSVYSGLQAISSKSALVAVHDSARPLLQAEDAAACMLDAQQTGAALLGVPVKPTIKEVDDNGNVIKTLVRARLWEVQTPQVIKPELLREGFELVRDKNLEVTDDVSIIEALGKPVKVTRGSYTNIKVTTPDDMLVAEGFLISKKSESSVQGSELISKANSELAAAAANLS